MHWELHHEALESLLEALDADRDTASIRYETLRRKLIDFFSWQRCLNAKDLADDEALDRYAFSIARLILKEEKRSRELPYPAPQEEDDALPDRMIHCLNALARESREFDHPVLLRRSHGPCLDDGNYDERLAQPCDAHSRKVVRLHDEAARP